MKQLSDPVFDFAAGIAATHGRDERVALLSRAVERFGIGMFVYARFAPDQSVAAIETTYPDEWVGHYLRNNYADTDVVAVEGRRAVVPFDWAPLLRRPDITPTARKVFVEAADFGIRDGLTVPVRVAGSSAVFSFVVHDRAFLADQAMAERHAVQLMAMYYHGAACDEPAAEIGLTEREREVLAWTARGKTGWEIGQILHVAERTVTFHIENAKAKLGVSSRSHAAVKAIMLGLITP